MGIVGNPVSHSRSPAIHNAALAAHDLNAVYVPMLVEDLPYFLRAFGTPGSGGSAGAGPPGGQNQLYCYNNCNNMALQQRIIVTI